MSNTLVKAIHGLAIAIFAGLAAVVVRILPPPPPPPKKPCKCPCCRCGDS